MEEHRDLQKFTAGTVVAQRCGVLSPGREARGDIVRRRMRTQHPAARTARWGRAVRCNATVTDRRIDKVKRLTPGWGIESFAESGSDRTATEALQEAETEAGFGVRVGTGAEGAVRAAGSSYRTARPVIDVGLTA